MTEQREQSGLGPEKIRARDTSIEIYKAIRAHELMLNQATAAFEHAVTAPLIVLNGGAAVAFLTLLGALADPQKSRYGVSPSWVVPAVISWALGLVFVELAVTCGFSSQRQY